MPCLALALRCPMGRRGRIPRPALVAPGGGSVWWWWLGPGRRR